MGRTLMRDLAKLLDKVSAYTHSDLIHDDTLHVVNLELEIRTAIALETIADAMNYISSDLKKDEPVSE